MKPNKIEWFLIFTVYFLINDIRSKSFLEAAKDKVEEVFKYDSEEYRNEPASLNHLYYSKRGKEELEQCRNLYQANYNDCRNFKTCNFCSANSGCGWCDEKKICLPLDLGSRKDEYVPLCMGDCIKILKIDYCYKGLFEPENTQDEINFANMDQVVNQEKYRKSPYDRIDLENEEDRSFANILEKTLEKNIIESQKIKPEFNYNFMQKNQNIINENSENSKEIKSHNKSNKFINNPVENENFIERSMNLLETMSKLEKTQNSAKNLSSESLTNNLNNSYKSNNFSKSELNLNSENTKNNSQNLIEQPDCDEANNGIHGVSQIIPTPNNPSLNFIPNGYLNYPNNVDLEKNSQKLYHEMADISKDIFNSLLNDKMEKKKKTNFIKANLDSDDDSQEGYLKYLKEFVPNFEFPQFIKSDLEQSINEIKREKLLLWLRGFSLNDKISKIDLPIYKNLNFTNEDQTRKMFLDKFYKDIVKDPNAKIDSLIYKNMLGNSGKIINKDTNGKTFKDYKVIDSKFVDKNDLVNLVKQSNMRF